MTPQPSILRPARSDATPVRVRGPQELAASVPYLLGFHPHESLVLLCLSGPRRRIGPVLRMDLPHDRSDNLPIARYAAQQAALHATSAALFCFTDDTGKGRGRPAFPHAALIRFCVSELRSVGVPLFDAMLVRNGAVWSYLRHRPGTVGYPVPDRNSPSLQRLHSEYVAAGLSVLPSRDDLARSVAGPDDVQAATAVGALDDAADRMLAAVTDLDHRGMVAYGCRIAEAALERLCGGIERDLDPSTAADLVTVMLLRDVRDAAISWLLGHREPDPVPALLALARWTPDVAAVEVCTALAMAAYRQGSGALAHVALDRALAVDPQHRLAGMLLEFVSAGLRPDILDQLRLDWSEHPANPDAERWRTAGT